RARGPEGPVEVRRQHATPLRGVDLDDRREPRRDAGVRHGDVEVAEELDRVRDRLLDLLPLGDVRLQDRRAPPETADVGRGLLRRVPIPAVIDRHVGALARELEDDAASDAATTTRHERRFAVELPHRSAPNAYAVTRSPVSARTVMTLSRTS